MLIKTPTQVFPREYIQSFKLTPTTLDKIFGTK